MAKKPEVKPEPSIVVNVPRDPETARLRAQGIIELAKAMGELARTMNRPVSPVSASISNCTVSSSTTGISIGSFSDGEF
jgi:hypothetical protein